MYKIPLVSIIIVLICIHSAIGIEAPDGVAGLKWNDTLSDCIRKKVCSEDSAITNTDGEIGSFSKSEIKIGPYISKYPLILFDKKVKKLKQVVLTIDGVETDYKNIIKALTEKYGPGSKIPLPGAPVTTWSFTSITIFAYYQKGHGITLMYTKDWDLEKLKDDL